MNNKIIIDLGADARLSLFSINGSLMFTKKQKAGRFILEKQFPAGEYVFRIDLTNYSKYERIQITK